MKCPNCTSGKVVHIMEGIRFNIFDSEPVTIESDCKKCNGTGEIQEAKYVSDNTEQR